MTIGTPDRSGTEDTLRIASYPGNSRNPYFELFYQALGRHGFDWIGAFDPCRSRVQELTTVRPEVVHFHWPESIWRRCIRGRLERVEALVGLWRFLRTTRRQGVTSVWTVHNVEPHEDAGSLDRWGYRLLAWGCDLLISHSQSGVEEAVRRFRCRRRKFLVMPMGSYVGRLPEPAPAGDVRTQLRLKPDRPTVGMVGGLRPYKGIELACQAVAQLKEVQLILAGPVQGPSPDFDRITTLLGDRVAIIPRELSDQEVSDFVGAADAVLLPYRKITGSAALLTAFSLRRPVVTSDLPYFRETIALEPEAGIVCRRDASLVAQAIRDLLSRDSTCRRAAAYRLAERFTWDKIIGPVAEAVRARVNARRNRF